MMIEVEHISKSFTQHLALNDVSFQVREGEILGLLGPNGAGKTTLLRLLNKIIEPDKGVIRLNKEPLLEKHLVHFGYLPEERGLYKSMTVFEHAKFLGRLKEMSVNDIHTQVDYWLNRFDIAHWKHKKIEQLSKGMAQKVQFICTVLHQPKVLILDEPFSGFDPVNVELIEQELKEMRAQGKTILLSSHNMKSVEDMCDRVVLIHQSRKLLEGPVSEIKNKEKTGLYAVKFKGSMIALVNALWTGFELHDKEILSNDRFIAYIKMRQENSFQDLLKTLIGQIEIEAAWEVLPSMQSIFVEMVQPKQESA